LIVTALEGAINKNGQSRETGNIWCTRHRTKTNKTKIHHYAQTNTNTVKMACALLQTTGGKDELSIVCML
jgi:hypothetical protein